MWCSPAAIAMMLPRARRTSGKATTGASMASAHTTATGSCSRPFRRFREVLDRFPEQVGQGWNCAKDAATKSYATDRLIGLGPVQDPEATGPESGA